MGFKRFTPPLAALVLLWGLGIATLWTLSHGAVFAAALAVALTLALIVLLIWNLSRPRYASEGYAPDDPRAHVQGLRLLLDQLPVLILGIGVDGRVRALNRAARTEFETEALIIPPPSFALDPLEPRDGALVTLTRHGTTQSHRLSLVFVPGVAGLRALAVLANVEPHIRAAQADTLRDVLRILGHEVMNGLAPIRALAEALPTLLDQQNDDALRETAALIARKAEAIDRFTQSYRTLARIPPPILQPTECADIASELAHGFESQWGQRIGFTLTSLPGRVMLDHDLMVQAIRVLLDNAAQASLTHAGPAVALRISANDGFQVEVRDNGAGIDPAIGDQIFTPFFSTKSQGDGVGLAIAQQIVRAHGGNISFLSEKAGTAFIIRI